MSKNPRECLPLYYYRGNEKNIFNPADFKMKNVWNTQRQYMKQVIHWRNALSSENFNDTLCQFMKLNEGCVLHPYVCAANIQTVGVGLFLRKVGDTAFAPLAIAAFKSIGRDLEAEYSEQGRMEEHIQNKTNILSEYEALRLLTFVLDENIKQIQDSYFRAGEWSRIPLPLRVTLHSLYYHNPIFLRGQISEGVKALLKVQSSTSSVNTSKLHATEEEKKALKTILYDISATLNRGAPYNGSPVGNSYWESIQYRRWREMVMASTSEIDEEVFPEMVNDS